MSHNNFGLRLKRIRKHQHLSQEEISRMLNISRQAYSNYEQGRSLPPPDTLANLSILLNSNLFSIFIQDAIADGSTIPHYNLYIQKKGNTMYTKKFANTLAEKRTSAGYTQAQAADLLYISRSSYNHYEQGNRIPPLDVLIQISILFQTDPMEFLIPLVPKEALHKFPNYAKSQNNKALSPTEAQLLSYFRSLNPSEQEAICNISLLLNKTNSL